MRPLIADINLSHLTNNYIHLKKCHGRKLLAVLKANAYGHGSITCARALNNIADGFAVACLEEAYLLRTANINLPILLLGGVFNLSELFDVENLNLWIVIHSEQQLQMLLSAKLSKPITVWLKMDSGMHRAGFYAKDYYAAHKKLSASKNVSNIINMTHFACADELDSPMTLQQTKVFDEATAKLNNEVSMANSAAILAHPSTRRDWGRAGLALYGISPFPSTDENLCAVMCLHTQVCDIRQIASGESIGYGATFTTKRPTIAGLITVGYADGYPRTIEKKTPVLVNGQIAHILGRVSMDVMSIDLTDIAQAKIGSHVELWGPALSVNKIAKSAGTIAYELLCNVKRANLRYSQN